MMKTKIETIAIDVIETANRNAGNHFFDADTLRFFRSRVSGEAYRVPGSPVAYFATTEKNSGIISGYNWPRKATVRRADLTTGDVSTVGDFQAFATMAQAKRVCQQYLGMIYHQSMEDSDESNANSY